MGARLRQSRPHNRGLPKRPGVRVRSRASVRRAPAFKLALAGLLIVVALAVGISFGIQLLFPAQTSFDSKSPGVFLQSGDVSDEKSAAESGPSETASSKLAGSTERIDEHGIVHGVTPEGIAYTVRGRGEAALQPDKVTLAAVGDQVVSQNCYLLADAYAGESGDGVYSFTEWYQEIGSYLRQSDLRYMNHENVTATSLGYEVSGYPMFNAPDSSIDAVASEGFNLVNFDSNHIYDKGSEGIEATHEVFARYPEILVGGSYLTREDRETVHMIERNGMTFALLGYCYGFNGMEPANEYYACGFDEGLVRADVARAQQVADAVIVAMHWGTEYHIEINDEQVYWAGVLADLKVDLVLGSHAHSIQPVEYVAGSEGVSVPVVFGLSDIVSGWTLTDTIFSTVLTCDFVRQSDGSVAVENLLWHPAIEWSDGGDVYVRLLEHMSDEEIQANTRTPDVEDDVAHLHDMVDSTIVQIPSAW